MLYSPETYAEMHTAPLPPLLQQVLDYTLQHHPRHHMISGHVQGQLLRMISHMLQPAAILEIGTFTGFSALCLAEGLQQPHGRLYTLELRTEDAETAQHFFNQSPFEANIQLITGNALSIIPNLTHAWDLVFIDADKTAYSQYLDLVLPQVRPGGFILADNVLFHGEVLQQEVKGKNAKAIADFNEKVRTTKGIDFTLLTIRDGLMIIRKNS